ncbi:MAG TPA: hypothetical protein VF278_17590 [Pirellulales bacterium]
MKAKPPLKRRTFANDWEEIEYVYQKLLYWLYTRENSRRAMPYADRLAPLLIAADSNGDSILGQECWSLIHEAKGDLDKAIEVLRESKRLCESHGIVFDGEEVLDEYSTVAKTLMLAEVV